MYRLTSLLLSCLLFAPSAFAGGHGHGHQKHHRQGHHEHDRGGERVYYREPAVHYAPAPLPRVQSSDQRTTQGLVGGALGSIAGYEISKGDPLGAGIGAAAGAWIGNGIGH